MNLGGKQLRGLVNGLPVGLWAALAMVGLGFWLHSTGTLVPIAGAAVAGSVLFFVLTNFGVWALGSLYPTTGDGFSPAPSRRSRSSAPPCWTMRLMPLCSSAASRSPRKDFRWCADQNSAQQDR